MKNAIPLPHTCPKCGVTAHNHQEIEELFGYRNMKDEGKDEPSKVRVQAECKKCRSKSN